VANTKFDVHPSYPRNKCSFLDSGWFWKIQITRGTFGKFILVDGAGLIGASNAIVIVPNSDAAFIGKTGSEARRTVEIYGLSPGIALVDFKAPGSNDSVVVMQVEVVDLPNSRMSFVKPAAPGAALTGPGLPAGQYQLAFNRTFTSGPAEALFDGVPNGTMHVVVSTHGQMSATDGITMSIAGGVSRANCSDVFKKLQSKASQGVVWISGCDAGADNTFCKAAALASGFYIVAPAITVPVVRVPAGMIDYFERSMIKFFSKDSGDLMKSADFLVKQKELQFSIVPG